MRECARVAATFFILFPLGGCYHAVPKQATAEINVADPAVTAQMVQGFHGLEANAWRWTAQRFAVTLQPPAGADRRGARLSLRLVIPESQIKRLGPMTLFADVDDQALQPETFQAGGSYTYVREIPSELLRTNFLPVIFSFDKSAPPSAVDGRELAAIVTNISLKSK